MTETQRTVPLDLTALSSRELAVLATDTIRVLAGRGGSPALAGVAHALAGVAAAIEDHPTTRTRRPTAPQTMPQTVTQMMTMYGISEPRPGRRWRALFDATWPAYRDWYLRDGDATRPTRAEAERRLARHMPELVPVHARLVDLVDDDDDAARMLTLWDPPHVPAGCSQAVLLRDAPVLVRNYDYHPDLFERVSYSSAFTGRRVVGTGDCLWGLLDGVNDAGVAVSLTLGGRRGSEEGFSISLIVRYLLEVCGSVDDVREVLPALPVNAAYNITALDRSGSHLTAFIAPGTAPEFSSLSAVTNHRGRTVEDPGYARWLRSIERQQVLERTLAGDGDEQQLVATFLSPPLFTTRYAESFGTLYTAVYRPGDGAVEYHWPGSVWRRGFDSPESTHTVALGEPRAA